MQISKNPYFKMAPSAIWSASLIVIVVHACKIFLSVKIYGRVGMQYLYKWHKLILLMKHARNEKTHGFQALAEEETVAGNACFTRVTAKSLMHLCDAFA
jgi:hypothetical protein